MEKEVVNPGPSGGFAHRENAVLSRALLAYCAFAAMPEQVLHRST